MSGVSAEVWEVVTKTGTWELGGERIRVKTGVRVVFPDPVGTWSHLANWQLNVHNLLKEGRSLCHYLK